MLYDNFCSRGIRGFEGTGTTEAKRICIEPEETVIWQRMPAENYTSVKYLMNFSLEEEDKYLFHELSVIRVKTDVFEKSYIIVMGDNDIEYEVDFVLDEENYVVASMTNKEITPLLFSWMLFEYMPSYIPASCKTSEACRP